MTFKKRDSDGKIDNGLLYPINASDFVDPAPVSPRPRRTCDSCFGEGRVARDRYEPRRLDISCWRCNGAGTVPS